MTSKKPSPRQRAYFLLGYRRAKSRYRAELRELEERLDDREAEVGSGAAQDDDIERPDND